MENGKWKMERQNGKWKVENFVIRKFRINALRMSIDEIVNEIEA